MLLKEIFDGFNVPLRSAISVHIRNFSKEEKNTSREVSLFVSSDEGVDARQNLVGIKHIQDCYHDRKRKMSFGVLIQLLICCQKTMER